jgi:hypothetical protein
MKHFMIRYKRSNGTEAEWHQDIASFIANLDNDPDLKGKILYRCMKIRDGADYFHLAAATDEAAVKAMQSRDFFKRYTEKTRLVAGGEVTVSPLDIVAETGQ